METPPTEDPGEEYCPIGALAMVTAAVHPHPTMSVSTDHACQVKRAYRMHLTGDYVEATQSFNTEFWSKSTALFMEYITKDLAERH